MVQELATSFMAAVIFWILHNKGWKFLGCVCIGMRVVFYVYLYLYMHLFRLLHWKGNEWCSKGLLAI